MNDFVSLFYPRICFACGNNLFSNESLICTSCLYHLPKTNFHKDKNNPVSKVFWGRVNIETAAAFYYYRKGGKVQHLLHQMKYKGHREIGTFIGKLYGTELSEIKHFSELDTIIPVPLHPTKLRKRGFNQAEMFANGLAEGLHKKVNARSAERIIATSTQTKKSRYKRWENVSDIFKLKNPDDLSGQSILAVDDVITTGATMEAFVRCLLQIPDVKVSVASIAFAH